MLSKSARILSAVGLLVALAACTSPAGAPSGGPATKNLVVGVSNSLAGNGWREEMICSIKAEALQSGAVSRVIALSKNGGPSDQIQDLQNLISQGVNVIIVNPSDPDKLNDAISEAKKQGITVIAVDNGVNTPDATVVTNDQVEWGRLSMEWIAKQLNGKGDVLYLRGIQGAQADTDRDAGVQSVLKNYPGIKVKEAYTGWDNTKAGEIAIQEFTAKQYDAVWTSGQDFPVVNAIKTAGRKPVPVTGMDNNGFVKMLLDGTPGAIVTNPAIIGAAGLNIALKIRAGEQVAPSVKITPELWSMDTTPDKLKANYFADRAQDFSSTISIPNYTTFTKEQLFACKGPGE
jgi:ribose transport system substrate-binding protein